MFVCVCHAISDTKLHQLVTENDITDIKEVKKCTALGTQCGKCIRQAKAILELAVSTKYQQVS
ncbi:(2Fe-2S)-binding protein [Vibrio quintilis]|uniref:(2Fe-2S)-binding protein n=1 Tax=Vibrio quintilis TaxID=1117707 RepID=UPI000935CD33|nr:(2Fe-2S)-binding protein [Vibrio quintilis]